MSLITMKSRKVIVNAAGFLLFIVFKLMLLQTTKTNRVYSTLYTGYRR